MHASAPASGPSHAAAHERRFDIAIVGAGIVGASIAWHLSRAAPAPRVLLLEAEAAPGSHTTGRSAALYSSDYGPPQVRALTRASRGFFITPPAGFSELRLWQPRGALFVGGERHAAAAQQLQAELQGRGVAAEHLAGEAVRRLVPVLQPAHAAHGLYVQADFDLEVDALLQGLLRGARAAGLHQRSQARVRALQRQPGGGWHIDTEAGPWQADTLVNAAGAWADELATLAGARPVALQPRRRTAFVFEPPAGMATAHWPAVVDFDEQWYFKPDAGLLLGSPANADLTHPHDVMPEELDVATGIHRIESATTLRIRRPRRAWAGLRCFVADGEPVCGFDAGMPGFFWAAALGGYGIQSAPAFGRLCAQLLLQRPVPEELLREGLDLRALQPDRVQHDPAAG